MSIHHRRIPRLPERPRVHPVAEHISRSYPVGRQSFSRAYRGEPLSLSLSAQDCFPDPLLVRLVTTLNSKAGNVWSHVPFKRIDDSLYTCRLIPDHSGVYSFHAEFSVDNGVTWLQDTVPDAWILIDPPQAKALRLYTLIPTVSGTIADWRSDLPRIRDLGFNAIHLLPITPLGSSESPYAARNLFDVDANYLIPGSLADGLAQLEEFAEEAKALSIRLCFDLVLNHVAVDSEIARHAPDWIVPDQSRPDGLKRAGYWSGQGWSTWEDLVLINYEHPAETARQEIRAYMTDYALFWAKFANDTGGFVRFDNLHSSDGAFIEQVSSALHAEFPELGILAEYFTDDRTLLESLPNWGLDLVLATPWNYRWVPDLRGYLTYTHRQASQVRYFMPITTHDSGTPAQEFGTAESTIPRYVVSALLGNGATGIVQGVEYGLKEKVEFIGVKERMNLQADQPYASIIRRINAILEEFEAFQGDGNMHFVDEGHAAILAAFRQDRTGQSAGFLVACNFDISHPQRLTVDVSAYLGAEGSVKGVDLIGCDSVECVDGKVDVRLEPCDAWVVRFSPSE